tara:strand:+ start:604 stop:1464 length:861 start_codon:yes stop_codon:yes gene_type:complete
MKAWVYSLLISLFVTGVFAETFEQEKADLKKAYEAGQITKIEYNRSKDYLKNLDNKNKENKPKKTLSLNQKKSKKKITKLLKKKKEEEITLKKIEGLGEIVKFDNTYFPDAMLKQLSKGCSGFKCQGSKAAQALFKTFNRSKIYSQKNPGQMIKAMAMFEVFYSSKLWYDRKSIERYKEDDYQGAKKIWKRSDEKKIRSLFGINKGRKSMREALGMTIETPSKEAINKFWLLGEFLDLGTGVKNKKLAKDLKQRQDKIANYRSQITKLKKKLQDDLEKEEDEKSVE